LNKYYSSIKKQLVKELGSDNDMLASVYDLVIDVSTGGVIAIVVIKPFVFSKHNIVLPRDIIKWTNTVYVKDALDVCDIDDIVRLRYIKNGYNNLINFSVYTESGNCLGMVIDYMFDDSVFMITKLIVGNLKFFGFYKEEKMRIARNQILKVSEDKIIVKDTAVKEFTDQEEPIYNLEPLIS